MSGGQRAFAALRTQRLRLSTGMGLAAISALSACTVAESYRVTMAPGEIEHGAPIKPRCSSEAGSYSLSKTTWSFEIKRKGDSAYFIEDIVERRLPDNTHTYCLDYLQNALASDKLGVGYTNGGTGRHGGNGLLDYVASYAVDKSAIVARNLIRAIFVGISGQAEFEFQRIDGGEGKIEPRTFYRQEFDPLDADAMARMNEEIAKYGFCFRVQGYSVSTAVSGEAYCADPVRSAVRYPSQDLQMLRSQSWKVKHPERSGVLYRPRLPYFLEVYTQEDPGRSRWKLSKLVEMYVENLAPIVSLGIRRAMFADARVGLEFDAGVLKNFCLSKTSEVTGFAEIPLEIVYGIAQLPTETIRAELDRASNTKQLVEAETNLIAVQRNHIEFLKSKGTAYKRAPGTPPGVVSHTTGCTTASSKGCEDPKDKSAGLFLQEASESFLGDVCNEQKVTNIMSATADASVPD